MISTPTFENREPGGPIRKGTTYIVRPAIAPRNSGVSFARASSGAIQLLVGPTASLSVVLMKVRCSVRATSWLALRWSTQPGSDCWFERDELARGQALGGDPVALRLGPVADDDAVRGGQGAHLFDPAGR